MDLRAHEGRYLGPFERGLRYRIEWLERGSPQYADVRVPELGHEINVLRHRTRRQPEADDWIERQAP